MLKSWILFLAVAVYFGPTAYGQYSFGGQINDEGWSGTIYLSLVDDYRKTSGVFTDQILATTTVDSLGGFVFTGDDLPDSYRFYRIHADACSENQLDMNHYTGHCPTSKEIVFLASNTDTINFPISFDAQMFCSVEATNPIALKINQVDSLKEVMRYEFAGFRSKTKNQATIGKWFENLHQFGKAQNEPLVELYIHSFLTDRSSTFYDYYKEDLNTNDYYDSLADRLTSQYPVSPYTEQFTTELASDKFALGLKEGKKSTWQYYLFGLLLLGLIANMSYWNFKKRTQKKAVPIASLTPQEQKILGLILQNKTNKEIASDIFVSHSTVKTHINNLYRKVGVQSREELKSLYNK
ncbi:MAG: helix-turn-helix transcriptional regulator [Gilvibacter sp.]